MHEVTDAVDEAIRTRALTDPIRSQMGHMLRSWRRASRLTLGQVGRQIGVTATTVSSWEAGRTWPSVPESEIERALRVPAGSIARLVGRGPPDSAPTDVPTLAQQLTSAERLLVRVIDLLREVREELGYSAMEVPPPSATPQATPQGSPDAPQP